MWFEKYEWYSRADPWNYTGLGKSFKSCSVILENVDGGQTTVARVAQRRRDNNSIGKGDMEQFRVLVVGSI